MRHAHQQVNVVVTLFVQLDDVNVLQTSIIGIVLHALQVSIFTIVEHLCGCKTYLTYTDMIILTI